MIVKAGLLEDKGPNMTGISSRLSRGAQGDAATDELTEEGWKKKSSHLIAYCTMSRMQICNLFRDFGT